MANVQYECACGSGRLTCVCETPPGFEWHYGPIVPMRRVDPARARDGEYVCVDAACGCSGVFLELIDGSVEVQLYVDPYREEMWLEGVPFGRWRVWKDIWVLARSWAEAETAASQGGSE